MTKNIKYIFLTIALTLLALNLKAQEPVSVTDENGTVRTEYVAEFDLFFKVNDATFYLDYLTNQQSLDSLDRFIQKYGLMHIAKFEVVTYSSPEGSLQRNEELARGRSQNALKFLVSRYPVLANFDSAAVGGEAWEDLAKAIEADETLTDAQKAQAVGLIRDPAIAVNVKKVRIMALPFYKYMLANLYPKVRHSALRLISYEEFVPVVEEEVEEPTAVEDLLSGDIDIKEEAIEIGEEGIALGNDVLIVGQVAVPVQADTVVVRDTVVVVVPPVVDTVVVAPQPAPERVKATIFTLNTNLLYDLVTALNFEVEVPIAGHFSLMVEDVFPWWETGNKYCFQMWEMGVEARYWLKGWDRLSTDKMRGFFVGPYVMSSKYDFQNDRKFNYQGEYWSVGATAGYAVALGKKKWANLDFSLSLGYLLSDYRHYNPGAQYEWLLKDPYNVGKYTWIGPTKAKITLCIPIKAWFDAK